MQSQIKLSHFPKAEFTKNNNILFYYSSECINYYSCQTFLVLSYNDKVAKEFSVCYVCQKLFMSKHMNIIYLCGKRTKNEKNTAYQSDSKKSSFEQNRLIQQLNI